MKIKLAIILLSLCFIQKSQAQKEKVINDIIKPILVNKSVLSGVGLKKVVLKDDPEKEFYQRQLYRGNDISVYVVSTENWNNDFKKFWFDEFVYMFHGEAIIKPKNGASQLFYSGDYFFAPKGYSGEWEIKGGNHLHYELSVISTKRADSTQISKDLNHKLFSKSTLSGASIQLDKNGKYSKILKKGVELTIELKAEKPTENKVISQAKEKLIQLLSGQITLTNSDETSKTFYTGDFFIIPKNYKGTWESKGHGLVKYLTVRKTEIIKA